MFAPARLRYQLLGIVSRLFLESAPQAPFLPRRATHASAISKPECAIRSVKRRSRHLWTPEGDEMLASLVDKHGLRWTLISREMDLGLSVMSYRRRWEVLQSTNQGAWTLAEDRKLERSVRMLSHDKAIAKYGWWVQVAKLMDTKRTPRDCYWRWNSTVFRLSGASDVPLRTQGVNIRTWLEEEKRRFDGALSALTDSKDSTEDVERAREKEPWLVPEVEPPFTQPAGFWLLVAEAVGTRTAQQCRAHWLALKSSYGCHQIPNDTILSVPEAKRLVRIVEKLGKRWRFIGEHYFPQTPYHCLFSIYYQWKKIADKYKVDLLAIDPEAMLIGYKPGSSMALRRTGSDGYYDPNGTLRIVKVRPSRSPLVPFLLALKPSLDRYRVLEGPKPRLDAAKPRRFIVKRTEASYDADLLHHGTDTLNQLIRSLKVHGEDWVAIGKDVGLRASLCQRLYKDAVKILPSLKAAALAGEANANHEV
ncbi:myb-like DNA-binding protein bas1 [Coemansia sp. RSA 2050]|nr:myb-like DNA-binding protein bas1 [Coemansia sp. RSA 2050]KAJ2729861.1 myb-like DNA-binding protein bas1 [Coemansia sp. BCRC 34962]